mmetsp:Transcript_27857/g.41111  ORF Transcript_27857/g.41111 Transcript_27857/m.41111 type:complete len:265 (-) Transcript_27857:1068-1862(-)
MNSFQNDSSVSPVSVASIQTNTSGKKYVTPNCNDVLCGRGRTAFEHPGNQRLREKIALTLDKYNKCGSRQERSIVILETVNSIMIDQGGRFLKSDKETGKWYDGGIAAAKLRVSTALRDARIPNKVKCMESLKGLCSTDSQHGYHSQENTFQDSFSTLSTHLMETDLIIFPSINEEKMYHPPDQILSQHPAAPHSKLLSTAKAEEFCAVVNKMDCDSCSISANSLDLDDLYNQEDVALKNEIESLELNILGTMISFNPIKARQL